jgi:hypothetical protein
MLSSIHDHIPDASERLNCPADRCAYVLLVVRGENVPLSAQGLALDLRNNHNVASREGGRADYLPPTTERSEEFKAFWLYVVKPLVRTSLMNVTVQCQ